MLIDVLTIFPEMFTGPLRASIVGRAQEKGIVTVRTHDIRAYTRDKHHRVDDTPFGGGAGMVMKAEPFFEALTAIVGPPSSAPRDYPVILLSPRGQVFHQAKARVLAAADRIVLLCGHYEGIDERVCQVWVDEEISIGDYVLTGGELAAMVVIDAVVRLLPGVLGDAASVEEESFSDGLLEYPQYTRPAVYREMAVPAVLLSGHHALIRQWRHKEAMKRTFQMRPELLLRRGIDPAEQPLLVEALKEIGLENPALDKRRKKEVGNP
ncbi:MAG: tRNA (guanosine(37)-N1)-methyltransferase TrmD [Heliobacteriaceae bacterium]|nr:tRNA (guanosine(37)-N1)-methyltransferase TrmD [Heliobacteriaceae bacterium]MDD4587028.1 tRNA (guanosine(37)-N1)-methyltransferase TrmD [Heliobacteriaceae bacterium]